MHDATITIDGKRWHWKWWHFGRGDADGACDAPTQTHKAIRVRDSLQRPERQKRLMVVAIHEAMHALAWHVDEQHVTTGAEDIADLLWKLGYRRMF